MEGKNVLKLILKPETETICTPLDTL